MYLADQPKTRISFLALMYVGQGLPYGFVTVALVAYLASRNASAADIAIVTAMAMAPWPFKWAFGPVVDRFGMRSMGRRRPWIIVAQSAMVLTTLSMILFPDLTGDIWTLGLVMLVHNVFVSLQDVSVDALAVDLLHGTERERASGVMYGASYVGNFMGGAGLGLLIGYTDSLRAALLVLGAAQVFILAFPIFLRERRGEKLLPWTTGREPPRLEAQENADLPSLVLRLLKAFRLRAPLLSALLALLVLAAGAFTSPLATRYVIQDVGWSQERFSAVAGGGGVLLGLFGSLAGGFLASRIGARRMICLASAGLGLTWLVFGLALHPGMHRHLIAAYMYTEVIFQAAMTVALFALFMRVSWPVVAATQFTAYMALLNVSRLAGTSAAGAAEEWITAPQAFLLAGAVQIAMIGLVVLIDPTQTRRLLGDLEEAPSSSAAAADLQTSVETASVAC